MRVCGAGARWLRKGSDKCRHQRPNRGLRDVANTTARAQCSLSIRQTVYFAAVARTRGDQIGQHRSRTSTAWVLSKLADRRHSSNPSSTSEIPADNKHRNHDPDDLRCEMSQQTHAGRFYAETHDGERHGNAHRAHGNVVVRNDGLLLHVRTADVHAKS